MKPNVLTRERLAVIESSIEAHGGVVTIRHLMRNHGFHRHIIEEAIEGGFVAIERRKGPRGRPSQVLKIVSQCYPTKLPPCLVSLDHEISIRHWTFVRLYVAGEYGIGPAPSPGLFSFKRRAWVAYQRTYPQAKSQAGARASASRLLKKSHIQAAIAWFFAKYIDHIRYDGNEPRTESEIWKILFEAKSHRTRRAPSWARWQWEQ